jgi:hypothetical protein
MKFFDDNTRSWWTPITGGANVPALNDLLAPHNISLGERILQGKATLGDHKVTVSWAWEPWVHLCMPWWLQLLILQLFGTRCSQAATAFMHALISSTASVCCVVAVQISYGANIAKFPAGGYLHVTNINDASGKNNPTPGDWAPFGVTASGKGQVAVMGDTNCLDSSHMVSRATCTCCAAVQEVLVAVVGCRGL